MKIYSRKPGASETVIGDDVFLVARETREIVHLDVMGAALWRLLEIPRPLGDILATFVQAFPDIAQMQLEADLSAALQKLVAEGLVAET